MAYQVKAIKLGNVSCYLVKTDKGYILIDTGGRTSPKTNLSIIRSTLEKELESSGCLPGNLQIIILTHGHFDHTDNCVYLKEKYHTKIAMHKEDSYLVENGVNPDRKFRPFIVAILVKCMMFFTRMEAQTRKILATYERFKPDFYIDEGFNLSEYGFDAEVLYIPGHSKGSIGILTSSGDLFCGDIMVNFMGKPIFSWLMTDYDFSELDASIERIKKLSINTVYPGHGKPFKM